MKKHTYAKNQNTNSYVNIPYHITNEVEQQEDNTYLQKFSSAISISIINTAFIIEEQSLDEQYIILSKKGANLEEFINYHNSLLEYYKNADLLRLFKNSVKNISESELYQRYRTDKKFFHFFLLDFSKQLSKLHVTTYLDQQVTSKEYLHLPKPKSAEAVVTFKSTSCTNELIPYKISQCFDILQNALSEDENSIEHNNYIYNKMSLAAASAKRISKSEISLTIGKVGEICIFLYQDHTLTRIDAATGNNNIFEKALLAKRMKESRTNFVQSSALFANKVTTIIGGRTNDLYSPQPAIAQFQFPMSSGYLILINKNYLDNLNHEQLKSYIEHYISGNFGKNDKPISFPDYINKFEKSNIRGHCAQIQLVELTNLIDNTLFYGINFTAKNQNIEESLVPLKSYFAIDFFAKNFKTFGSTIFPDTPSQSIQFQSSNAKYFFGFMALTSMIISKRPYETFIPLAAISLVYYVFSKLHPQENPSSEIENPTSSNVQKMGKNINSGYIS